MYLFVSHRVHRFYHFTSSSRSVFSETSHNLLLPNEKELWERSLRMLSSQNHFYTITHSFLGREVYYRWRFVFGVGWDSIWWFLSGRLSSDSIDGVRYIGQAASRRHVSRCLSARPHNDCLVRHPDILGSWQFFLGGIYTLFTFATKPPAILLSSFCEASDLPPSPHLDWVRCHEPWVPFSMWMRGRITG